MIYSWSFEILRLVACILDIDYWPHIVTKAAQQGVSGGTLCLWCQGQILLRSRSSTIRLSPILVNILFHLFRKVRSLSIGMKIFIPRKNVSKVVIYLLRQIKPILMDKWSTHGVEQVGEAAIQLVFD